MIKTLILGFAALAAIVLLALGIICAGFGDTHGAAFSLALSLVLGMTVMCQTKGDEGRWVGKNC